MNIKTTTGSPFDKGSDKRMNLEILRSEHQPYFEKQGIPDAYFTGKVGYVPPGKNELHIGLFYNEISKGEDVYIEMASQTYEIEDPERKLYKYSYNAHFNDEYDLSLPGSNGVQRYLVPVGELIKVEKSIPKKVEQIRLDIGIEDPEFDTPIESMTVRDLAAIMLNKPVSTKKWLNDIINKK